MIKLYMRNYNMILTEKQQKYQHYRLEKLVNMNILQVKKYYSWSKGIDGTAKFTHSPLGKAFKKQTKTIEEQRKKQFEALKILAEEELESMEGLFPKSMITDEIKNEIDEDEIKRKKKKTGRWN